MTDVREISGVVPENASGKRLDQVLAKMFPEFSRSRLKGLIIAGQVTVNGGLRRPRDPVYAGEPVLLTVVMEQDPGLHAESMPLAIVYQDKDLLVVNKPAGLVVHPGAGNPSGTLVNGLLHYDPALADLPRAGLIHRLDKDTSGVLVVARTIAAHTALTNAMQERRIHRHYLAVCAGRLSGGGTIDEPIGRHPGDRTRMAVQAGGREAVTHYRVAERYRGNTLVSVTLETGRTHQIRVHFAYRGHPLVGDRVYGRPSFPRGASSALREFLAAFARQALHAFKLEFEHPVTAHPVSVSVQPPADFQTLCDVLRTDQDTLTAAGNGDAQ
ncbi:MAG: 23S rRNA pseudouridine(1911/1915/1917) synthase RluD [Gammaproteobacteria bacterium]|nr:23S rRNA pseudouridine(1911/1915/1917) synthase RluD [Gammaproteobacteria bacterium]